MQRDCLPAIKHISANCCVEIKFTAASTTIGPAHEWVGGKEILAALRIQLHLSPQSTFPINGTHTGYSYNSNCSLLCQVLRQPAHGFANDVVVFMNQGNNREDPVHWTCRIKQVRWVHRGWARYSCCSTSAAMNVHPTRWYQRYSSLCHSHDLDLCSALQYFGQPHQPLLFLLLWPPHLALSSSQAQE